MNSNEPSKFRDDTENFNPPTNKISRRNSILKSNDIGKTLLDEDEEMTTRFRKSRRVSFASKPQIKEIENNQDLKENDIITIANTNANAAAVTVLKVMNDISNKNEPNVKETASNLNSSDMDIVDTNSSVQYSNESFFCYIENSVNNDESIDDANNPLTGNNYGAHETLLTFDNNLANQTRIAKNASNEVNETLYTSYKSNQNACVNKTTFSNQSMDLMDDTRPIVYDTNQTIYAFENVARVKPDPANLTVCMNLTRNLNETNIGFSNPANQTACMDQTRNLIETTMGFSNTANQTACMDQTRNLIETTMGFSNLANQTACMDQTRNLNETAKILSKTLLVDSTACNSSSNPNEASFLPQPPVTTIESSFRSRLNLCNESVAVNNQSINQTFSTSIHVSKADHSVLEPLRFMSMEERKQSLLHMMRSNKESIVNHLNKMKKLLEERKQEDRERSQRIEQEEKETEALAKLNKELKCKLATGRKEILDLKRKDNESGVSIYAYCTDIQLEKAEKCLELTQQENESAQKDYEITIEKLNEMRERVKLNFNKLSTLKANSSTKQKLLDVCGDIFSNEYVPYKLINMQKDTIILSFYFDFIQVEIQATNIANDINIGQLETLSLKEHKCLNYPIKKLFIRSTLDSASHSLSIDTPFCSNDREKKKLKKKTTKNVPVFVRYCIDLILKDIGEGDLLTKTKKYKYIRDIPMLIAHLRLACECATNLGRDFENYAQVSCDTKVKCDFDFTNHIVSIVLPSYEDSCYYKLKLSILPGLYYQEAIPFSIEPIDPNDIFKPNIERISKVVEGQFFEDGSLRNYLKKLKLI